MSTPRSSKQFEFDFDKVFRNPKTFPLFQAHCKKEVNEDNINFLLEVEQYNSISVINEESHKVKEAQRIYETYIAVNSTKLLNLTQPVRADIEEAMAKGCYNQLFKQAYTSVYFYLRFDSFARFMRSLEWLQFVATAPNDLIENVGIPKYRVNMIVMEEEDFLNTRITDKDISLAKLLLKDYYFWQLVRNGKKTRYQIFATETHFLSKDFMAKHGLFTSAKLFTEIPLNARDALCIALDPYYAHHYGFEYNHLGYIPETDTLPSTTIVRTYSKDMGLVSGREYVFAETVFYDMNEKMFVRVARSILNGYNNTPVMKGKVRGLGFKVESWIQVSNHSCLHTSIMLCNPKGKIEPKSTALNFIGRQIVTRVAKGLCKGAQASAKDFLMKRRIFEDGFKSYQTLLDYEYAHYKELQGPKSS